MHASVPIGLTTAVGQKSKKEIIAVSSDVDSPLTKKKAKEKTKN